MMDVMTGILMEVVEFVDVPGLFDAIDEHCCGPCVVKIV